MPYMQPLFPGTLSHGRASKRFVPGTYPKTDLPMLPSHRDVSVAGLIQSKLLLSP